MRDIRPTDDLLPFKKKKKKKKKKGFLDLLSPTEALWTFYSHSSGLKKPEDQVLITRGNPKCAGSGGGDASAEAKGGTGAQK